MNEPNWPTTILPSLIGDQREFVVLLADAGRHRGAEQHRVHLDARVAQRVLDDVERDRVDRRPCLKGAGVGLDDAWRAWRVLVASAVGSARSGGSGCCRSRRRCRCAPGRISVVESISMTIAGPGDEVAGRELARGRRSSPAPAAVRPRARGRARWRRAGSPSPRRERRPRTIERCGPSATARRFTISCSASRSKVNSRSCSSSKRLATPSSPSAREVGERRSSIGSFEALAVSSARRSRRASRVGRRATPSAASALCGLRRQLLEHARRSRRRWSASRSAGRACARPRCAAAWSRRPSAHSTPGPGGMTAGQVPISLRDRIDMQRAGAAEAHQREVARIIALLTEISRSAPNMFSLTMSMMPSRRLVEVDAERVGDRLHRRLGAGAVELMSPPSLEFAGR